VDNRRRHRKDAISVRSDERTRDTERIGLHLDIYHPDGTQMFKRTDRDHRRSSYFLERESSDFGGAYAEEIRMATMIPMIPSAVRR